MPDAIDEIIDSNERLSSQGAVAAIKYIQRDIAEINKKLDDKYVTKEEFKPIKNLVYGFVALALSAIIAALLALIIKQ